MLALAVVGAAVLAFVSWACLREAQRMSRTSESDAGAVAVAPAERPRPPAPPAQPVRWEPPPVTPVRVQALEDATVPEADHDEALAAAAALWQVVVQTERA